MENMTLEEIKKLAKENGYEIEIEDNHDKTFTVWFGHEYTKVWLWLFEDLEDKATYFEVIEWENESSLIIKTKFS